jgi:hypothetical protein
MKLLPFHHTIDARITEANAMMHEADALYDAYYNMSGPHSFRLMTQYTDGVWRQMLALTEMKRFIDEEYNTRRKVAMVMRDYPTALWGVVRSMLK